MSLSLSLLLLLFPCSALGSSLETATTRTTIAQGGHSCCAASCHFWAKSNKATNANALLLLLLSKGADIVCKLELSRSHSSTSARSCAAVLFFCAHFSHAYSRGAAPVCVCVSKWNEQLIGCTHWQLCNEEVS